MTTSVAIPRTSGGAARTAALSIALAAAFALGGCGGSPSTPRSTVAPTAPVGRTSEPGSRATAPASDGLRPVGETETARVVRVVDGDTVIIDRGRGNERLRYIGMDTPESVKPDTPVQPYAKAAAARNAALVAGRDVILEKDVSETDSYGRLLRYVWIHDGGAWTMANMELVRTGYAHVLTYPPDVKYASLFVDAERTARDAGLGLWAAGPTP